MDGRVRDRPVEVGEGHGQEDGTGETAEDDGVHETLPTR